MSANPGPGDAVESVRQSRLERRDYTMVRTVGRTDDRGLGDWEQLRLGPGLFVSSVNAPPDFDDEVRPFEQDYLEFQFRFDGATERRNGVGKLRVEKGSLLISRQPGATSTSNQVLDGTRNVHLTIFCTPAYLDQQFGDARGDLRPHIAAALAEQATTPFALRVPLYPRLTRLAHDLARSHFTSNRRLIQAEGYVLILIAEILAILEAAQDDSAVVPRLSDRDFDKIHLVRERLICGTIPSPSLKELARDAGLGPAKLKDGFKALFGQSIFAFSHDLRMRHARELLRRNDMSIAHVAEAIGYNYQQSFTVAFHRYFGVLPRTYRRNPVAVDQDDQAARWSATDGGKDPDRMFGAGRVEPSG